MSISKIHMYVNIHIPTYTIYIYIIYIFWRGFLFIFLGVHFYMTQDWLLNDQLIGVSVSSYKYIHIMEVADSETSKSIVINAFYFMHDVAAIQTNLSLPLMKIWREVCMGASYIHYWTTNLLQKRLIMNLCMRLFKKLK